MRLMLTLLLLLSASAQAGLVARYSTQETTEAASENRLEATKPHHWWVLRDEHRVEFRSGDGQASDIWIQESDGFSLIRVFRPSQRAVHYTPSDLRALNVHPDWQALRRLEEPGTHVTNWDEASGLPSLREKHSGDATLTDTLEQIWPMDEAPVQPTDLSQLYVMDFSDLGDNEADPFFRQFINMGPVQHRHAH